LDNAAPLDLSLFVAEDVETGSPVQEPPRRDKATDKPLNKDKPVKKEPPLSRERASKPGEFIEPLEEMYALAGFGVSMFDHDGVCGPAIANSAHQAAVAWDELAQKNPAVRRSLRKLTQGSAWAGVFTAHLPIALAIFTAHMPKEGLPGPFRAMVEKQPETEPETEPEPEPVVKKAASAKARNERRSAASV
jgi:hypothetical protein